MHVDLRKRFGELDAINHDIFNSSTCSCFSRDIKSDKLLIVKYVSYVAGYVVLKSFDYHVI